MYYELNAKNQHELCRVRSARIKLKWPEMATGVSQDLTFDPRVYVAIAMISSTC